MQAYVCDVRQIDFLGEKRNSLSIFFAGCNFMCPYCNVPQMLSSKEEYLMDTRELKKRISESEEDVIVLSGGEPTLQRLALLEIAKFGKDIEKIVLHTNCSKPDTIKSLVALKLLDLVVLDLKAPLEAGIFERTTKSGTFFKPAKSIIEDINMTLEILRENSVRAKVTTTIVPGLIFRKEDIEKVAKIADSLSATLIIQQFDNTLCYDTRYMSIKPASYEFLQNLKDFIKKEYPNMDVRIDAHY